MNSPRTVLTALALAVLTSSVASAGGLGRYQRKAPRRSSRIATSSTPAPLRQGRARTLSPAAQDRYTPTVTARRQAGVRYRGDSVAARGARSFLGEDARYGWDRYFGERQRGQFSTPRDQALAFNRGNRAGNLTRRIGRAAGRLFGN